MVGDRELTALIAKSYADQMVAAKEGAEGDLPENIPELMIKYISALARPPESPEIETVISAAKTIAWRCVQTTFRPAATSRADLLTVLGGDKSKPLLSYLKDKLRILQSVGAANELLRFSLDPLAEYLAALQLVDQNGRHDSQWRQFLEKADRMDGAPHAIRGFLVAVRDCCLAKHTSVPPFVADEIARRAGIAT
jgi:NACHT conflict system protein